MIPELRTNSTFIRNWESDARIKVHEGGTSSGKTIGLLQYLMAKSFEEHGKLYSIARATTPNLIKGPMKDFRDVVLAGLPDEVVSKFTEQKQKKTWVNNQTGTRLEFVAFDDEQKGRGPRRNKLYCNEANELGWALVRQLMRRTEDEIIFDYNPSLLHWWIDDKILNRDDSDHFFSTYRDNPYLTRDQVAEIEEDVPVYEEPDGTRITDWDLTYTGDGSLVSGDVYEWAVYGLGRRGSPSEAIYPFVSEGPFPSGEYVRALDFGFQHPMVLADVARIDATDQPRIHYRQQIFSSGLTLDDLCEKMDGLGLDKNVLIYADSARPEMIEGMVERGWNVIPTEKGPGSVLDGIDFVKRHKIVVTPNSQESKTQLLNYRRKKVKGIVQDDPLKHEDDAPDALRYGAFEHYGRTAERWGAW